MSVRFGQSVANVQRIKLVSRAALLVVPLTIAACAGSGQPAVSSSEAGPTASDTVSATPSITASTPPSLSLSIDRESAPIGTVLRLTARLTPATPGNEVTIEKLAGESWKEVKRATTGADGSVVVELPTGAAVGESQYRASLAGTAAGGGTAASDPATVLVQRITTGAPKVTWPSIPIGYCDVVRIPVQVRPPTAGRVIQLTFSDGQGKPPVVIASGKTDGKGRVSLSLDGCESPLGRQSAKAQWRVQVRPDARHAGAASAPIHLRMEDPPDPCPNGLQRVSPSFACYDWEWAAAMEASDGL